MIDARVLHNFRTQVTTAIKSGYPLPVRENNFLTPVGDKKSLLRRSAALTPALIDEVIVQVEALPAKLPDFNGSTIINVIVDTTQDGVCVAVDFLMSPAEPRKYHNEFQKLREYYVERWLLGLSVTHAQRSLVHLGCTVSPQERVWSDGETIEEAFNSLHTTVSVMSDDEDESHVWLPIEFNLQKTVDGFRASCVVYLHDTMTDAE